ncbi:Response regulator UvrY [subsurface metagenome]
MLKILIADDHEIVRKGLKTILVDAADKIIVDEASNGQEALNKINKNNYNMVVLDISMPGKGGLDVLKQIKSENLNLPVLVLSMHSEEQYARRVLRAGASGYMTKSTATEELLNAIYKVARGGKYISSTLAEELALNIETDSTKPLHAKLSDREYQVMIRIAAGKTIKEIAGELCLSPKTITTYRTRVLEKMKLKNNSQLIFYAIENNLE